MSDFVRGITDTGFVLALNQLQERSDNYWSNLLKDPDIFIGIRDNYINAYYLGNSICKLEYRKRAKQVIGKIHRKYLKPDNPDMSDYLNLFTGNESRYTLTIDELKKKSKIHPSIEKDGVHNVCKNEDNVLDVEIEFTRSNKQPINGRKGKYDRIDYLKIEEINGKLVLVFYEAKDFTNSEIKAQEEPHVLGQMRGYEDTLKERAGQIVQSYNIVCKNIVGEDKDYGIHGIRHRGILFSKAQGSLTPDNIDFKPRLIIFGSDKLKNNTAWNKTHYPKLKNELNERLILA